MTKKAMTSIKKVDQHPPTAQFLWGLLCSLSSIDQERNNVSLFNIVEEIGIPQEIFKQEGKKVIPFVFEIVMLLRRIVSSTVDDREITTDIEVALVDPEEKELKKIIAPVKFQKGIQRNRLRIRFNTLDITVPGNYGFRISVKNSEGFLKHVGTIPLEVKPRPFK